jgi:type II secretory pathway pseudopilin PulG
MKIDHKFISKFPAKDRRRRGATLVEVAIATMMLAVLIVPAVKLVGQSRDLQRRVTDENELVWQAENLLDRYRIEMKRSSQFNTYYSTGLNRVDDLQSLHLASVKGRVQIARDRSTTGRLVTLSVETWSDANRNGRRDGDERFVALRSAVSAP